MNLFKKMIHRIASESLRWLVIALQTDRDVQIQNSEEALCLIKPDITQLWSMERVAHLNQSSSCLWKCAVNGRNTHHPLVEAHTCLQSLCHKPPTAGIVYRSSPLLLYPLFRCPYKHASLLSDPHCMHAARVQKPPVSVWWLMCVYVCARFRETVEKNTQDLALIWCRWSFWPTAEEFYCSDISHTLSVSFLHFRSFCFSLSDEQRCAMSSQGIHKGQPAQKMETFKMINHTCLRNNGINLDCLLLVGAEVLGSPPEALRFFVNWVIQLNKMAFEQTRLKHIMCFPFSPPK